MKYGNLSGLRPGKMSDEGNRPKLPCDTDTDSDTDSDSDSDSDDEHEVFVWAKKTEQGW